MKTSKLFLFIAIATLTSCSSTSIEEENEVYNATKVAAVITIVDEETALLEIINEYRATLGLDALIIDATIYNYAQEHNEFMIEQDQISHTNFSIRSTAVIDNTIAKNVSENVARFFATNEQVLNGWLNSPSHKETIENKHTHTVISITLDSEGNKYYTQLFYN